MDPSTVAAALTATLAPAMPFLMSQGERIAGEATKALGEAAWKEAQELWARLSADIAKRPGAQEAATELARNANDADAQSALRFQLRKVLEADPQLLAAVQAVIREDRPNVQVSATGGSIAVGGNATGLFSARSDRPG